MEYIIRRSPTQEHFFDIEFHLDCQTEYVEIQLPTWRPGRYELQNFAKNIQEFKVLDSFGNVMPFEKITKDCWRIQANRKRILLKYCYYANIQDAGNSYVDDKIFYLNFVNCLPYTVGRMDEPLNVVLEILDNWEVACALPHHKPDNGIIKLSALSYYQLVDSPFIAGPKIQSQKYMKNEISFYIHIAGNYLPNWDKILSDFGAFTSVQIEAMGDFPTKEYHFIIWILPKAYYHGVEHGSSTMIVLGPDIEGDNLITDLIGVCSHELFHAWNICKIRPKQLLPYDFTKENYFDTGFVAEGVTTYLGDLFLKLSGVFNQEEYLKELTAVCIRHFTKNGLAKQSLVDSSIDLWIDGYTIGIPNKKVSIYYKGAIAALILDLMIRLKFNHQKSLLKVMKLMWENFGRPFIGYSIDDYKQTAETVYEESLDQYFKDCIYGNIPLETILQHYLSQIGLKIFKINSDSMKIEVVKRLAKTQKYNLDKFLNNI